MYLEKDEDELVAACVERLDLRVPVLGKEFFIPTGPDVGWNWGKVVEKKNQDGTISIINPDGLVGWKPEGDKRARTEYPITNNLDAFLALRVC
jgi:hypothetical protein